MTAPTEVAHGYTLADIDAMARSATTADRSLASDARTRYDTAWSAIALALAEAEAPPLRRDLVRIGWQAIYNEVRQMRHLFGQRDKDGTNEVASSPRYRQYWYVPPERPDEVHAERVAVHQILGILKESQREAVVALAAHDDYRRAADALGLNYNAFCVRMSTARRTFRRLWFAPETAPPLKKTDRRVGSYSRAVASQCRAGHEFTPENTRYQQRKGRRPERMCRACEAKRGRDRWGEESDRRTAATVGAAT